MWTGRRLACDATLCVVILLGACACATTPSPSAPIAAGPPLIAVPTQEPAPTQLACMAALLDGVLIADPRWGVAVQVASGGPIHKVIWPNGFTARTEGGRLALLDRDGHVVAHTGDRVQVSGGEGGADDAWFACDGTIVVVQGG
jgi:hypothetical protein